MFFVTNATTHKVGTWDQVTKYLATLPLTAQDKVKVREYLEGKPLPTEPGRFLPLSVVTVYRVEVL